MFKLMRSPNTTRSGEPPSGEKRLALPFYRLLERFAELSEAIAGVEVGSLSAGDVARLSTMNNEYWVTLLDPESRRVTVQGGAFFSDATEAFIHGSSCGGSMLRAGWIGVGLQLELVYYPAPGLARSVITSPVEGILLERAKHTDQ